MPSKIWGTRDYRKLDPLPHRIMLFEEWETYRRLVPELLARGDEGKYIVIIKSTILGVWATESEALAAARKQGVEEDCFLYRISPRVPFIRVSSLVWPWLFSASRSSPPT